MIDLGELKAAVAALEPIEDAIAMDKALAKVDLILYELRQELFAPAREFFRSVSTKYSPKPKGADMDWSSILSDITSDLSGESESEKATHSNSGSSHD